MLRELFRIPGLDLPIYSFGLMLVLGCWAAMAICKFLAKRSGLNGEHFVNIGIIALIGGVVGARASHVLENWHQYFGPEGEGFWSALNIRSGGLTYYGGVILATPLCIAYGLKHKIPIRRGMDIVAPALMIGLALGRVGCFLNGCCWGAVCDKPWAVTFPYDSPAYESHLEEGLIPPNPPELLVPLVDEAGRADPTGPGRWATADDIRKTPSLAAFARSLRSLPVHPTQLYSTIAALLVCGILVSFYTMAPSPGRVFALMMVLEGIARFTIETLRVEPAVLNVGGVAFSFSMVVGVLLVISGAILWFIFPIADKSPLPRALPDTARLSGE